MHSRSFFFLGEFVKDVTFPRLELVDVTYFGGSNDIDAMTSVILLVPNLRTLSFKGHLLSNDDGAPMPANSIRTFKAHMILSDIGRFVSTITSMPELNHFTVGCFTCSHAANHPVEVLSHLTSLSLLIHDYSYNNLQAIITPLLLPNLASLSLVHEKDGASAGNLFKFAHLEHLLRSCANSLRRLHILHLPIDTKDLILMLETIPRLRELVIHWPQVPQASIETTIRYLVDTWTMHLAQLTSLELVWYQDVDEEMIIDMVEVRMACTRLRRVTLERDMPQANHGDKARRRLHLLGLDA